MATLLIGYDLKTPGKDYTDLWNKVKNLGAWWHNLDSTWIVRCDKTPVQVRDELLSVMDKNDELLVVDITGDAAAWRGFNESGSKWLKDNL